jgi:CheY-like chemotaxis protein/two-component sensor histidine kinase/HPt (histidine-containing phosphotransfer) domain-containing protein
MQLLLEDEKLTDKQQQLAYKIQVSGKSLLGIVNDVLDLAKIEANEMALEEEPIELADFFDEVCAVYALQAETKGLEFNLQLDADLPAWVMTDNIRLRQIVVNLLSNAIKFTQKGSITLRVEVDAELPVFTPGYVNVKISVTDTGIGIAPEVQGRLFKPFSQADSGTARQFGGTGLGLSIVHNLVHLLGGKVRLESQPKVGSKFLVDLPLKSQTAEEIAILSNQKQSVLVLIAQADKTDSSELKQMTRALGWRSIIVNDGFELVDTYIARIEKKLSSPDAIIVDRKMPTMDGLTTICTLINKVGRENLPPVLMLCATDEERAMAKDPQHLCSKYLRKPLNASTLFNAVNDAVTECTGDAKRVMQSTSSDAMRMNWLPNVRVLVVDDHDINLTVISNILECNGAVVDSARSGEEALILLENSSNDYDAVLMDIQMPGIDGFDTTRNIRSNLGLTALPIIALTAGALVEEKNRAFEAGMNDFLTKPINPSKVINVLRAAVEAYRGKAIPIEPLKTQVDESDDWPSVVGLNLNKAKQLLMDDKELFLKSLDCLHLEYTNLALAPESHVDDPKSTVLRLQIASQLHKLKNVSGLIGAEKIEQLATEAEKRLKAGEHSVKDLLTELSIELQALQEASDMTLKEWKQDKLAESIAQDNEAPKLKLDTVTYLLSLLEVQDMQALAVFDENKASFRKVMGDEPFAELQVNIERLNYKQAIVLIEAILTTFQDS